MKKVIILGLLILSVLTGFSQSLKGYTIGEKLIGDESKITSVAGIDGMLFAQTLKDGRIYQLMFIPSGDGKKKSRVYSTDVTRLKNGLEKKYGIKLKSGTEKYSDDVTSYYSKNFEFYISLDHNRYMDKPYELSLIITDNELQKIHKKEEQSKADSDF